MTDAPRQLSLSQFLENSAALMAAFRNELNAVQTYLSLHLQQLQPDVTEQLNFTVLQSLDEICQAFDDLSSAYEAIAPAADSIQLRDWPSIENGLKLNRVRHALNNGDAANKNKAMVEIF